jgi:hypothetical protein
MNHSTLALILTIGAAVAGCDSADPDDDPASSQTGSPSQTGTTERADSAAALEGAVRAALRENNRLAGYVLWHNEIPTWARRSTRGRALAEIRKSTAERRREGVRVRTVSSDLDIADIRLDPSYSEATATVRQSGRVLVYRGGRRLGGATRLNERARVELRRLGTEPLFVVWQVTVTR